MGMVADITGKSFGLLTVLAFSHTQEKQGSYWVCSCTCGNIVTVRKSHLTSGHTHGCGHDSGRQKTHGETRTRFYKVWSGMKDRCYNPNVKAFAWYGAKGITVCDEWLNSYESFRQSMWASYEDAVKLYGNNTTIDRIDSRLGYYPDNCRWISKAENTSRAQSARGYSNEQGT